MNPGLGKARPSLRMALSNRWPRGQISLPRGRWLLWSALVTLLAGLLGLLIFLAHRYEVSAVQSRLDAQANDLAASVHDSLMRNLQLFGALNPEQPTVWASQATDLLLQRPEMVRIEWRGEQMQLRLSQDAPGRSPPFGRLARAHSEADVKLSCSAALRFGTPTFSSSYFVLQEDGRGMELMDLCIPHKEAGVLTGYTVVSYSLGEILARGPGARLAQGQSLAFTDPDGTRLAIHGQLGEGGRQYTSRPLVDLPGNTLVLRLDTMQERPALLPQPLTALVAALAAALSAVLTLLVRDMRRRQQVEQELADALAFRKAMEDSLSTGLRARDLQGQITYVNPAFCRMVGFEAGELLLPGDAVPYWPPELAPTYKARQQDRYNNTAALRGGHESVFMRSDGTRFPVLIMEAPLINAQGKHTGWMSAVLDMSEQKRAEELSRASKERLQAASRLAMVGEMASLLSHELNQPL
ncbi:MAG: PAS domain-containing protein, partial [Betaproteobacteria bacterium]